MDTYSVSSRSAALKHSSKIYQDLRSFHLHTKAAMVKNTLESGVTGEAARVSSSQGLDAPVGRYLS